MPKVEPLPEKLSILTCMQLHNKQFHRRSTNYSFTQKTYFETYIILILVSGYLGFYDFARLCNTHALIPHRAMVITKCHTYDFTGIAHEDPFWKQQSVVPRRQGYLFLGQKISRQSTHHDHKGTPQLGQYAATMLYIAISAAQFPCATACACETWKSNAPLI